MISVFRIADCMIKNEFVEGNHKKKMEMIKGAYERSVEKSLNEDWSKNWDISLPLVDELVEMKFQFTKLLYTQTTWGKERYNVEYLNLEPVKHNQQFVTQILALKSIWGIMESLHITSSL